MTKIHTRKELEQLGAVFFGLLNDYACYKGAHYYHEGNDYQEGAGNHSDYQLFRLTVESINGEKP